MLATLSSLAKLDLPSLPRGELTEQASSAGAAPVNSQYGVGEKTHFLPAASGRGLAENAVSSPVVSVQIEQGGKKKKPQNKKKNPRNIILVELPIPGNMKQKNKGFCSQ